MNYVVYKRVSTKSQGISGLGMEAQQEMINRFLKEDDNVIAEFTEIESGRKVNRPQLLKAIEMTKQHKAKLLIAKLDRLARNVAFISSLMDSGVEFTAIDLLQANRVTIQLMASLAEMEARQISARTKASLAELKKRGVKLGKPENLTKEAIKKGQTANKEKAFNDPNNKRAGHVIVMLRKDKIPYAKIAEYLNENGYRSRKGNIFSSTTVQVLYKRYKEHFSIETEFSKIKS